MTKSELFAINEWLFQYTKNASFDDILYLLLDEEDDSIVVWDPFADINRRVLANCIANTETHFSVVTRD
jgi:hypothetical protein